MFEVICNSSDDSFFEYRMGRIRTAQQKENGATGFTIDIIASNNDTKFIFKIDISNNTLIFPEAVNSEIKSSFGADRINVLTYSIEQIVAEKLETCLDRGELNGRFRDFIDIILIWKENRNLLDISLLSKTLYIISKDRNTLHNLEIYHTLFGELKESTIFVSNFARYLKSNLLFFEPRTILEETEKMCESIIENQSENR